MLEKLGIDADLENLSKEVENEIKNQFKTMDEICEKNSMKVLSAFQECNLQEMHLNSSTGYGIDEAGRGPLAGPVVIGCVIMPEDSMIEGINDSKKVSEKKREKLYDEIIENAISWSVAIIDKQDIDELNILNATKKGVTEAIQGLKTKPELILVDALNEIDTCNIKYDSIIKGDAKCYSISAASILAKVTRDRIMRQWDEVYPQYGFAKHKGYGTKAHIEALKEYGPCPIHRKTFIKHFVD
mgnify:CR=1 FL=1